MNQYGQLHNHSHQLKKIISKPESQVNQNVQTLQRSAQKYYITYDANCKEIQVHLYSNGEQDDGAVAAMEMILLEERFDEHAYKKKDVRKGSS